jgi:hypothetical protein
LSVAFSDGKKLTRVAVNSACGSVPIAASNRWFDHALLYAMVAK